MFDILIAYFIGVPTGFALCVLVNMLRPRAMSVRDAGRLGAAVANAKRRAPIEAMNARLRAELRR